MPYCFKNCFPFPGGHLDVVQLLVNHGADIDSDDNRKVSCLVAAFRKGHIKVVKWMVKHVTQFPLDNELQRYISTVTDPVSILLSFLELTYWISLCSRSIYENTHTHLSL